MRLQALTLPTTYSVMPGRSQEALAAYDQAFKLEPTWVTKDNLNHEYGFALVKAGELEKGARYLIRIVDLEQAAGAPLACLARPLPG